MFQSLFEKLTQSEKEDFKRIISLLFSKTFIIRDIYDPKEEIMKINPDYRFVERNFELFKSYLEIGGFDITKYSDYGVISLYNVYEYSRIKLDKTTTLIMFILRLIFEEEREKVVLRKEVLTTIGQVVHRLNDLSALKKKPSFKDVLDAFRVISQHNIIQRLDRTWDSPEARIIILPSILIAISDNKINKIYEILDQDVETTEEEIDFDIIRGEEEL